MEIEAPPPSAPAGWYPGTDGKQRYWDGQAWLQLPPPEGAESSAEAGDTTSPGAAKRPRRTMVIALVSAIVVVLGVLGAYAAKSRYDGQQAAIAASQEADARAAKEKQQQAETAAKQAHDAAERASRKDAVDGIEASVKKMAQKHAKQGLIEGPIINVSCDPVAGGSLDDLSEKTTTFQCFVADKKNKDGTMSGYYYHATMNWDTGSYTYGMGES